MPSLDEIITPEVDDTVIVEDLPTVKETVTATPIGTIPDVEASAQPIPCGNQEIIDLIEVLIQPIANEHLIQRAKDVQRFLKEI